MEFILIASAHFCALLSPGPDFFLIMQAALRLPVRYCVALCSGIAMANGVYLSFAVLGLEYLKEFSGISLGLQYLGGVYLVFIGVMLLRAPKVEWDLRSENRGIHQRSCTKQFAIGFLSAILNPKNAVFYLAIFSVMVDVRTPLFMRVLYGFWMTTIVFLWDCFVVLVLSRAGVRRSLGGRLYYVEKISGGFLAFFGVFLAFS